MDSRLNLAVIESRRSDLERQAQAPPGRRGAGPTTAAPPRLPRRRAGTLHPMAVLASLTWH